MYKLQCFEVTLLFSCRIQGSSWVMGQKSSYVLIVLHRFCRREFLAIVTDVLAASKCVREEMTRAQGPCAQRAERERADVGYGGWTTY